jgi:hypothetical protein
MLNEYAKHFREDLTSLFAKQVHNSLTPTMLNYSQCFVQKMEIACLQASVGPKDNMQTS